MLMLPVFYANRSHSVTEFAVAAGSTGVGLIVAERLTRNLAAAVRGLRAHQPQSGLVLFPRAASRTFSGVFYPMRDMESCR